MDKMAKNISVWVAYGIIGSSMMVAGSAMTYFPIFLFFGPFKLLDFHMSTTGGLIFDALLCLLFFSQHSIMLRKSVKNRLYSFIPQNSYPAFYSIVSGIAMWLMLGLWQTSSIKFYQLTGVSWGIVPVLFALSMGITMWTFIVLDFYDPFGIKIQFLGMKKQKPPQTSLAVKGPCRWVRHPLYLAALLIIWAAPELTADRLLFSLLWTGWIIIGTFLEERDLRNNFGDAYAIYQKSVPMLIPYKIPSFR